MSVSINGSTGISGIDGSASTPALQGSDTNTGLSFGTDVVAINTGGTEALRVNASQQVGIGTSSPTRPLTVAAASGASVNILGVFDARSADSGTVGNCLIAFSDPNSTAGQFSARLGSVGDGLGFYTNGANERARIDSSGRLLVGSTTFFDNDNKCSVQFSSATGVGGEGGVELYNSSTSANSAQNPPLLIYKALNDTSSGNRFVQFYANGTTTPMGGIVGNGASNVQFATLSDIRDKTNITPVLGAINKIKQIEVVSFDWKNSGGHVNAGFVAQNVETVFPEYVLENVSDKDAEPRKGITGGMSAGYVAVLTAALQEAITRIETLETTNASQAATIAAIEARLTALEGGN